MTPIKTVGILGLGKMGCPMARHIISKGFEVIGYDPSADACRTSAVHGVRIAGSARELAQASERVIIVLAEADHARLCLPLRGTIKEVIKGLKIRMGLGMPAAPE